MRRALAALLAMLFSFLLTMPALSAAAASKLPSCCLRTGKHHCAMHSAAHGKPGSPSLLPAQCADFPHYAFGAHQQVAGGSAYAVICTGMAHRLAIAAQTLAGYRVSNDRSWLKRGPPSLILS